MGVTIYYAGRLRAASDLEELIKQAEEFAVKQQWLFERLQDSIEVPAKGFVIYPHPDCEPFRFEFSPRLKVSGFVKTQFAGAEIHIQIIGFLKQIRPLFVRFAATDDGEYWHTESIVTLNWHIEEVNRLIRDASEKNPSIRTKVRLPDGLMIDILE
jgi:phage pi2 protein 07